MLFPRCTPCYGPTPRARPAPGERTPQSAGSQRNEGFDGRSLHVRALSAYLTILVYVLYMLYPKTLRLKPLARRSACPLLVRSAAASVSSVPCREPRAARDRSLAHRIPLRPYTLDPSHSTFVYLRYIILRLDRIDSLGASRPPWRALLTARAAGAPFGQLGDGGGSGRRSLLVRL